MECGKSVVLMVSSLIKIELSQIWLDMQVSISRLLMCRYLVDFVNHLFHE